MQRRAIHVQGIVQGVGFRPFIFGWASRLRLRGFVRNETGAVLIEAEGDRASLDQLLEEIYRRPPPLARIDRLAWEPRRPRGDRAFRIEHSQDDRSGRIFISPDYAICADCLAELLDPADRRFHYPLLNCTNCGPRLSIITGAPYDRPRTTLAEFEMCEACRREYEHPRDRRFHAQPTACPQCGPQLALLGAEGEPMEADDPVGYFAEQLLAGRIGALKGLGGYHLTCDARSAAAVNELRRRKARDEKPLAVMVQDSEAAARLCVIGAAERELFDSPRAPIVLLRKRPGCAVAEGAAPGNPMLGVMRPNTPLHHLLVRAVKGAPLVMTSGNRSDEPIAYEDDDALQRLRGIADVFLVHNRPIHVRCDDSVTRVIDGAESPVRRSRGYAPEPVGLPMECSIPTLAVGGQLKATFALAGDRQAFLSHHLGDLDDYRAYRAFERDIALYKELFAVRPERLVHDLHPDYASTRYALGRAEREGLELVAVQHHHAHMASCMAEHGLNEPVIGVAFDGAGYGTDGAVWGGEFLVGDYRRFRRAAHLRYVGMPGGEQAIRQPWRMAAAHLRDASRDMELANRIGVTIGAGGVSPRISQSLPMIEKMLERRLNTPPTSSVGRLFDAVAAIIGVRSQTSYEGQAAMELEWLAMDAAPDGVYPFALEEKHADDSNEPAIIVDTRPLIRAVADEANAGEDRKTIARRFHSTVVELIAAVCGRLRENTGVDKVTLSGGVFMNALLTSETASRLLGDGFQVYRHQRVPPGDGGLSLGQIAIAAQMGSQENPSDHTSANHERENLCAWEFQVG